MTWLKDDTYGWDILFTNNESRCLKMIPMGGISCLQTMNYVVKFDTYGWDVLFPNNESRG